VGVGGRLVLASVGEGGGERRREVVVVDEQGAVGVKEG